MHALRLLAITTIIFLAACSSLPDREAPPPGKPGTAAAPAPAPGPRIRLADESDRPETVPAEPAGPAMPADDDVWVRIQSGLVLERHLDRRSVRDKLNWYRRHQDYLDRVAERARPYIFHIVERLRERGMPADLALLPIVESAYHPFALSPSRASGIWQFIPSTGKRYGLKQNWWYDGRRDIVAATEAALDYLEKLNKEFNGDWLLALAAYNSGELNVARAIRRNRDAGKPTDFFSLRLPRETRGYVPSLLAVAELVADPEQHAVTWQSISNEAYFEKVDIGSQIDLAQAARLAELNMDELYTLNPGFNRWATDPDGPHYLLVPKERAAAFRSALADLPQEERMNWQRHVVRKGETLGQIAARHHTSVSTLKEANGIRGSLIRTGHSLLIPTARQPLDHYTLSLDSRRFRGLKRVGDGSEYVYEIRRGDTLWDIGQHYGISVAEICRWNGISPRALLRPGQKVHLWVQSREQEPTNVASARHVSLQQDAVSPVSYTVRKGDSLWLIASRYGVSVAQLARWNNLSVRKYLQPGQEILIYRGEEHATDA